VAVLWIIIVYSNFSCVFHVVVAWHEAVVVSQMSGSICCGVVGGGIFQHCCILYCYFWGAMMGVGSHNQWGRCCRWIAHGVIVAVLVRQMCCCFGHCWTEIIMCRH